MNPEERQNLSSLLLSTDDSNVRLGLEFLTHNKPEIGHFHKELYLIQLLNEPNELTAKAVFFLEPSCPLEDRERWNEGFKLFNISYYNNNLTKVKKLIKAHEAIRPEFQSYIEQNSNYSKSYYPVISKLRSFDNNFFHLFEVYYKIVLAANPNHTSALFELAYILAAKKETVDEALVYGEHYISLKPKSSIGHRNMGWYYDLKGDKEKAYLYYAKALELEDSFRSKKSLAQLCMRMQGEYKKEGAQLYQELMQEYPRESGVWGSWAAYLWLEEGDYEGARKYYEKGLESNPEDDYLLGNLGELYIDELNEIDKGIDLYLQSLKKNKGPYRLITMVTVLVNKKQDWKQANKYYKMLKNKFSPNPIKKLYDLKDEQWEAFVVAEKELKKALKKKK